MNAAGAKINHCAPAGSLHHALGFGRQERLDVNLVHQVSLYELTLRKRCNYLNYGLIGKKRCTFRESVNLACKAKIAQGLDKLRLEERQGGEVIQSGLVKAYTLEVIEHRSKAGRQ